jgi:phosphoenolpyruvate carboxykinase (ATP)
MPLQPVYYMNLLGSLIQTHGTELWLVNTGWLGPNAADRKRVDILVSKAIINAVRDGKVEANDENFWYDPIFKMHVPRHVPGVNPEILDPRNAWSDKDAYRETANKLADIFHGAIHALPGIPDDILVAGPQAQR